MRIRLALPLAAAVLALPTVLAAAGQPWPQEKPLGQMQPFAKQLQRFRAGGLPALLVMRNALRLNTGEFSQRGLRESSGFPAFR